MLTVPTNPSFLETMVRFVTTFVPTLTIHRVHIGERTSDVLALQIEMTDGSIMFVEAQYWLDRIQVVLEYGWQRVDVWMYANFATHSGSDTPTPPLATTAPYGLHSRSSSAASALEGNGIHKIPMNWVFPKDIHKESFELG